MSDASESPSQPPSPPSPSGSEPGSEPGPATGSGPEPSRRWRLVALALVIVATFVIGRATGATERLTADGVRQAVEGAGAAGVLGFLLLFVVGELMHVPGLVFIGAAVAVWGPARGGAIGGVGALLSLVTSFMVVRTVGGTPLDAVKNRFARRILSHLETRPVTTVAAVRTVFILSPPVTYALALSGIRFRDYLVGSAVGLVLPLSIAVVVFDWLARR